VYLFEAKKMNYQQILFDLAAEKLQANQLMVDVLMDVLNCSRDAAYRRLQCRTELSFKEALIIAEYFGIALNEIKPLDDAKVVFNKGAFIKTIEDYTAYMKSSLVLLENIGAKPEHVMYYQAKDVPVFYHFGFKKLAAFKIYVWLKSVYNIQKINGENYGLEQIPTELLELANKQWLAFSKLNTVEIWNDTTIMSMTKQLEYFHEAGLLSSQQQALDICDEFQALAKVIYKQALSGYKAHPTNSDLKTGATYKMYYHEILLMDNHIYAQFDENHGQYFLPYAGVNYLSTNDPTITQEMRSYILEQTKKSSLISDISEKERNKFFIRIKGRIDALREKISRENYF
jgi:hypothetical protein